MKKSSKIIDIVEPKLSLNQNLPLLTRKSEVDNIPEQVPKWLSSSLTPKNDGNFIIVSNYPDLLTKKQLEKRMKKRERKAKK